MYPTPNPSPHLIRFHECAQQTALGSTDRVVVDAKQVVQPPTTGMHTINDISFIYIFFHDNYLYACVAGVRR